MDGPELEPATQPEAPGPAAQPGEIDGPAAGGAAAEPLASPVPVRELLLRRFAEWLDEALEQEEGPPPGISSLFLEEREPETEGGAAAGADGETAGTRCDQYALWSSLTALTQEIRLQGRTFKQLSDTLEPVGRLGPSIDAALAAHREALDEAKRAAEEARAGREERERELARAAGRRAWQEVLELLLDLRDRLGRGLEGATAFTRDLRPELDAGWLGRALLGSRRRSLRSVLEGQEALLQGYRLSLDRLNDALSGLGVSEVRCAGGSFDPRVMKAVELAESADAPEGAVLAVIRPGYEWKGEVVRPAEVKVSRRPAAGSPGGAIK